MKVTRKTLLASLTSVAVAAVMVAGPAAAGPAWENIHAIVFDGREVQDGSGVLLLEAPARAHDAAVVPITITSLLPQTPDDFVKAVYLVIDENPAPIAGIFHLEPALGAAKIATRVRVDRYTDVRAIAETADGRLYMTTAFVKASGGCSAPALKDAEVAMSRIGKMQLKALTDFAPGETNTAELLISHPNYTGLQIDQLTRYWIPPDYVEEVTVHFDDTLLMRVQGDISLSEDPAIRFDYEPAAAGTMRVEVTDIKGRHFEQSWPVGPSS
jgi:sulfur-oxidizing protein SoxY